MCLIHLTEHFGKDRPVRSIWVPEIKQYVALRLGKNASPSTVNREKGTLSKIFQVLVELQLVDANPCSLIKNLSQKSEERQAYISFRDVQRIAEKTPEWFRPLVWLAYYAGMRRGEVMGLTRRQVNLAKRLITLAPPDTKERGWKRIPLRKEVISILEESMRVSSLESDKVFLLRDSKGIRPVSLEGFKNPWERACKALGLTKPWPRFHDLRHTWRANARRSRMDPAIAEAILGHWFRGRTVNERYGRIGDKELIEAIDSMQFALGDTEILVASTKNVVDGNKKGNKLATNEVEKEERSRTSVT
jgi:integrase